MRTAALILVGVSAALGGLYSCSANAADVDSLAQSADALRAFIKPLNEDTVVVSRLDRKQNAPLEVQCTQGKPCKFKIILPAQKRPEPKTIGM